MYVLDLEFPFLPKLQNRQLRGDWRVRHAETKRWKKRVYTSAWPLKPTTPLTRARITCTRVSSNEPDYDGLVSSFKAVIDGLVEAGIISNDKPSILGQPPTYLWEKGKRGYGKIRIKVEQIKREEGEKSA